ncbi:MAG: hypothetical protein ACK5NK_07885 [Niabella sp.]
MKISIKFIVVLALFFITSTHVFAQPGQLRTEQRLAEQPPVNPIAMAERQTDQIVKKLKLNTEKDAVKIGKINDINVGFAQKMIVSKEKGEKPNMQMMTKLQEDKNAAMKSVLSKKEYKTYKKMQDDRMKNDRRGSNHDYDREDRGDMPPPPDGGPGGGMPGGGMGDW